jgi:hypothetical protein
MFARMTFVIWLGSLLTVFARAETLHDSAVGFSVDRIEGWFQWPLPPGMNDSLTKRLSDDELVAKLQQRGSSLLFRLTKYDEDAREKNLPNPSFQATIRRVSDDQAKDPVALLEAVIESLKKGVPKLDVTKQASAIKVGAHSAAEVELQVTQPIVHRETRSRIVVVVRGIFAISVTMTDAPKAGEDCAKEFDTALKSLKVAS